SLDTNTPGLGNTGLQYNRTRVLTAGATVVWDWLTQQNAFLAINQNTTISLRNVRPGAVARLTIVQDASHTVTWDPRIFWSGGAAPVMTIGAGKSDLYTLHATGSIIRGRVDANYNAEAAAGATILSDTFTAADNTNVIGRAPDTVNLPGGVWMGLATSFGPSTAVITTNAMRPTQNGRNLFAVAGLHARPGGGGPGTANDPGT